MQIRIFLASSLILVACSTIGMAADPAAATPLLITNDDLASTFVSSTASFYTIAADGTLTKKSSIKTNGNGIAGGFFAANRILVSPPGQSNCVYVSNAMTGDIAGIQRTTRKLAGNFPGSSSDVGAANGIGLAASPTYLYASYSSSSTIGTFQVQSGCMLTFVGDLLAVGLNGGLVGGLAVHGNMLIATYGDGSIESFDISAGMPVSNGDAQDSAGYADDHLPNDVDITQDGHYAIFGDASTITTIEVSDISSGKLTQTVAYDVGTAWNSGSVRLSPDETVIYVSNSSSGGVTAAFFDKTTGKVTTGCSSPSLKNFYTNFVYAGTVAMQLNTGTGGLLYVPEFGSNGKSYIGVVQFTPGSTGCTLTEIAASPVNGRGSSALLSIGVYPPRLF